jgi:hypothetical protein
MLERLWSEAGTTETSTYFLHPDGRLVTSDPVKLCAILMPGIGLRS